MTTHGERLYVFGGNHFRGSSDYDDVLECEYYVPQCDKWVRVQPMLTGQSDVGIAVYKDRIYVTGGYRWVNFRLWTRYFWNICKDRKLELYKKLKWTSELLYDRARFTEVIIQK